MSEIITTEAAWPAALPVALALNTEKSPASERAILDRFRIDPPTFALLRKNPRFLQEIAAASQCSDITVEQFRSKATVLANDVMEDVYEIAKDEDVDPAVRRGCAGDIVKWAYPQEKDTGAGVPQVNVQINL